MNKPPTPAFPGAVRVPAPKAPSPQQAPPPKIAAPQLSPRAAMEQTLQPMDTVTSDALIERPGIPMHPAASLDLANKYGIIRGGVHHVFNPIKGNWEPARQALPQQPAPPPPEAARPAEAPKVPEVPPGVGSDEVESDDGSDAPTVFEIARARDMMWEDLLNNPDQQERIRKLSGKIDPNKAIAAMLSNTMFAQRVPIRKGVFEPTYQQVPFWVERRLQEMLVEFLDQSNATKLHAQERFAFWGLVCSLRQINDIPMVDVFKNGSTEIDKEKFFAKEKTLLNLPVEMIVSLLVHYNFFTLRLRELFKVEDLGNG